MSEIWAGMATLPERAGARAMAIESLLPQVDHLHVAFGHEAGLAIKLTVCEHASGVYLGVDDDLVYPPDYVQALLAGLERHPRSVVGFHGYRVDVHGRRSENYRCLDAVGEDVQVDVLGSGVIAFRLDELRVTPADVPDPQGAEFWISILAEQAGLARWVLAHPARWFTYTEHERTMWNETEAQTGSFLDYSEARDRALHYYVELRDYKPLGLRVAG
jgi:hypothetical protein